MLKVQALFSKAKATYCTKNGKLIIFCCAGILLLAVISIIIYLFVSPKKTFTDSAGTVWQRYTDSNGTSFKVYIEQASFSTSPEGAFINSECDPQLNLNEVTELKGQNYTKGVDRPNHCRVIAGYFQAKSSAGNPVNTFVLLPDGSLLTLDGSIVSTIQINIDDDGTRIVQSSGNVYYRIAKQSTDKKFVIQAGNQEFTAHGTKVFTSIDNETVKLGLFEGAGTLTEFTRDSEAVQIQVGTFAQYLYKSAEQIKTDQLLKMSVKDLLNSNGFFAKQLENDDSQGLSNKTEFDFAGMQAFLPEMVNIEEDYILNKMQSDIDASNKKMQEDWDNLQAELEAEDAKRAAEREEAHEERMSEQQAATSQSSGSSSSSSSSNSSDSSSNYLGCVSKSKPATYSLCKMGGGTVSGNTCCFK